MKRSFLAAWVIMGICTALSTPASALNSILPIFSAISVEEGSTFTIDIMMDFDEITVGGGVEVTFGPSVTFQSFAFDSGFPGVWGVSGPANDETAQPLNIGFGLFLPIAPFGFSGQHLVGTLTFLAGNAGSWNVGTAGSPAGSPTGPFASPYTPYDSLEVSYGSTLVQVTPVPEPSSAALMALGLAFLATRRWRSREI